MNEDTDSKNGGLLLALLRWLEMRGLELDHGRLRKAHEEDAWWVAQDEELTGPHGFKEILKVLLAGGSPVQVVHASLAGEESPPWEALQYRPLWLNPRIALLWRIGWWTFGVVVLYAIGSGLTPVRFRGITGAAFLAGLAILGIRKVWRQLQSSPRWLLMGWSARNSIGLRMFSTATKKATVLFLVSLVALAAVLVFPARLPRSLSIAKAGISSLVHGVVESGKGAWAQAGQWAQTLHRTSAVAASNPVEAGPSQPVATAPPVQAPEEPTAQPPAEETNPVPASEEMSLAELANSPALWPKSVILKEPVSFPAVLNGKVVGFIRAPKGATVGLAKVEAGQVTLQYQGGTQTAPASATDVLDRVRGMRGRLADAGQASPVANTIRAAIASRAPQTRSTTSPAVKEEIPGLDAQSPSQIRLPQQ